MPVRLGYLIALSITLSLAACTETGTPEPVSDATPETVAQAEDGAAAGGPTVVSRLGPQMTATAAANRLASVEIEEIPGVVVPGGAELVEFEEPTEESDARAAFTMPNTDESELRNWFREQMTGLGWEKPRTVDGSLVFHHREEFSARYARQGLKRTATVHFSDTDEGLAFDLIVEEPAPAP